jgi:ABC-2 type transport system ATP-binding protein
MALTADHLVVIGRGRLIADTSVEDFIRRSAQNYVRVRSPRADDLVAAVRERGADAEPEGDGAVSVTGLPIAEVGEIALAAGIALHELSPQQASLEEAFMELTRDSVEYHAADRAESAAA